MRVFRRTVFLKSACGPASSTRHEIPFFAISSPPSRPKRPSPQSPHHIAWLASRYPLTTGSIGFQYTPVPRLNRPCWFAAHSFEFVVAVRISSCACARKACIASLGKSCGHGRATNNGLMMLSACPPSSSANGLWKCFFAAAFNPSRPCLYNFCLSAAIR